MHQAVATSFDPFTATWTKFLHSELVCTSRDAIDALLKDSEKELAKRLSASGNTVPFQGVMEQTFALRREGQRNDSISADSMRSDPVIGIPASTLSDTASCNFVEVEHPVEVPASGESLVDKVEEPAEDNWGSWGVSRTKKNGGKNADPEAPKIETIAEESAPPDDEWSFGKNNKKDKKKKGKSDVVVDVAEEQIEEPAADVVPDDDFGWGNFGKKKDKKKKSKSDVVEEPPKVEEPIEAPDPEPEEEYMGWANAWGKKDMKERKNTPIEVIDKTPASDPVPVPANDAEDDWGTWGASKNDKKGKGKKSFIEALAPKPTLPNPPEIESVSDPVEDTKLNGVPASLAPPPRSPSASESVWHPISGQLTAAAAPTNSTTNDL